MTQKVVFIYIFMDTLTYVYVGMNNNNRNNNNNSSSRKRGCQLRSWTGHVKVVRGMVTGRDLREEKERKGILSQLKY